MDAPIDFFTELVRTQIALYNRVDERIKAAHGVPVGTIEILSLLDARENPRVDDIVRALDMRVGTASKIVDRFVESGWLERIANPNDRRSSWLVVTEAGQALLRAATPDFASAVAELSAGLSAADVSAMRALLAKLDASIAAAAARNS
jgi:DNA-binding MarR family transcriptional regulator